MRKIDYLKIGKASDLEGKEKVLYRALEIMPGFLSWLTLFAFVFFSYKFPIWTAIFVVLFDTYWLIKTIYLGLHLRSAYGRMKNDIKKDWIEILEEKFPKVWREIYHLIILPIYKEPEKILDESLKSLKEANWPKEKKIVVLTVEERGGKEQIKIVEKLKEKYKNDFGRIEVTVHLKNLKGEIKGKGANETWAAKFACKEIIEKEKIPEEKILISSFDADTRVEKDYFAYLSYRFLSTEDRYFASYQPIPLFTNNLWEAPAFSRVMALSSTFWHTMNQERPEKKVTFSSHSMPFLPLKRIGFWQKNVVSEDSRIFWNLFLYFDGRWKVVPLYYPLYMDANVGKNFWQTMKNIYKQQRRWAYGCADIAYFLFNFFKNKKISFKKKWQYGFPTFAGFYSWATNSLIIFLGGWLPLILGGERFKYSVLAYRLPFLTRNILTLAMVGLVGSAILTLKLLPPKPPGYKKKGKWQMILQWLLAPLVLIIFGSFPALEAQTRLMLGRYMDFWFTPKVRKMVIKSGQ